MDDRPLPPAVFLDDPAHDGAGVVRARDLPGGGGLGAFPPSAAALPVGFAEVAVQFLPKVLHIAGHDDQVLGAALEVLDEVGQHRLIAEAEPAENLLAPTWGRIMRATIVSILFWTATK